MAMTPHRGALSGPGAPHAGDGPVVSAQELLFHPLWALIVPTATWRQSHRVSGRRIPDGLLESIRIWIFNCYPEANLVHRLIEAGDGSMLPPRDPLIEPERADPLERASTRLWARAADVLGRPIPSVVLEEMAYSSGLRTVEIAALLADLAVIFQCAPILFPFGSGSAPVQLNRARLEENLYHLALKGPRAWAFAMVLLLTGRADIAITLPAARAVARRFPEQRHYADMCDEALADIFPLFEARCQRVTKELELRAAQSRSHRRIRLWLDVPELATVSALTHFANRCSLHVVEAARLKTAAGKAARLQFALLEREEVMLEWPPTLWSDSMMIAFERGNRRLRNLVSLGSALSRPLDYRQPMERIAARYRDDPSIGLSLVERMRAIEILLDVPKAEPLLKDYLSLMPLPLASHEKARGSRTEPFELSLRALGQF